MIATRFPLNFNPSISVREGIKVGHYDRFDSIISSMDFSIDQRMKIIKPIEVICFDGYLFAHDRKFDYSASTNNNRKFCYEEIIEKLRGLSLFPAGIRHLLAFGKDYPDFQRKYKVISFGSMGRDNLNNLVSPCLYGNSGKRCLGLDSVHSNWPIDSTFLAISE